MIFFKKMRKQKSRVSEVQQWFDELDAETQQETTLKYLRKLDNKSLKNLYEAVEHYRAGDKILNERVKDPEPETPEELLTPSDS